MIEVTSFTLQDLLEASKSYNHDLVPRTASALRKTKPKTALPSARKCGLAFRLAMMTQADEVFRTRFQDWTAMILGEIIDKLAETKAGENNCRETSVVDDKILS